MNLMKLRLDVFFSDISQHFGIYLVALTLKLFIYWHEVRGDMK